MPAITHKYLIVGPAWVGDMVMAQSLFRYLKQRDANAIIDVLSPPWSGALLDRMPEVDSHIEADFKHGKLSLGSRISLASALRACEYNQALVLPNSMKAALVPALARIKKRTGFVGEQRYGLLNDIRRLDKTLLPMTAQRFLALAREPHASPVVKADIPIPKLVSRPAPEIQSRFNLNPERHAMALCPGAEFGPSKQWPAKHYAQLAEHFIRQGWQVWLLGSEKDQSICTQIAAAAGRETIDLAGVTTLPEAIDVLSLCQMVVSNDSGLMHIAAALQVPLVAVYGSTDPNHTPPLSKNHLIARNLLDCSPCFSRECPLGHHNCMQQLRVSRVVELVERLL